MPQPPDKDKADPAPTSGPLEAGGKGHALAERPDDPPIVARLAIEIRSDGSRVVARGALEDLELGQHVGLRVEGASPLELALSLARSVFQLPAIAKGTVRALLQARHKKP